MENVINYRLHIVYTNIIMLNKHFGNNILNMFSQLLTTLSFCGFLKNKIKHLKKSRATEGNFNFMCLNREC